MAFCVLHTVDLSSVEKCLLSARVHVDAFQLMMSPVSLHSSSQAFLLAVFVASNMFTFANLSASKEARPFRLVVARLEMPASLGAEN